MGGGGCLRLGVHWKTNPTRSLCTAICREPPPRWLYGTPNSRPPQALSVLVPKTTQETRELLHQQLYHWGRKQLRWRNLVNVWKGIRYYETGHTACPILRMQLSMSSHTHTHMPRCPRASFSWSQDRPWRQRRPKP